MSDLDPKTFDIASIFTGQEVPTEDVPVVLNARVAYDYATVKAKIDLAQLNGEDTEELEERLAELEKLAKQHTYIFRVAYTPKHVREEILNSVLEKHPLEFDILGRPKSTLVADDLLTTKNWAIHIQRIIAPNGAEMTPTEADIAILRANAPDPAQKAVQEGIDSLYDGVSSGLDSIVSDHAFLSQP